MNDFVHSCNAAASYPKNNISRSVYRGYQHSLQAYVDHLDLHANDLFGPEDKAALDFWDLTDGNTGTRCQ